MIVRFQGREADQHKIEAYSGAESLAGISRATVLVAHYASTGAVRFRAPFSSDLIYFIESTKPGSLTFVFSAAGSAARGGGRLVNSAGQLLGHVVRRAVGQAPEGRFQTDDLEVPPGDVDALAEAVTPSLLRAHKWIGSRNQSIEIGDASEQPIILNSQSKEYLETEQRAEQRDIQDVSVGALNVNGRNGRVYFHDLARTVPFYVPREAAARSIPTLSRYLTQYAEKTGATVNIQFERISYADGRLKRIAIYDCYAIQGLQ